jgi:hypothetical protein
LIPGRQGPPGPFSDAYIPSRAPCMRPALAGRRHLCGSGRPADVGLPSTDAAPGPPGAMAPWGCSVNAKVPFCAARGAHGFAG